jgi:hypothetical protein
VVVGLDTARAVAALDRLAPTGAAGMAQAAERAARLRLPGAGASDAILAALDETVG